MAPLLGLFILSASMIIQIVYIFKNDDETDYISHYLNLAASIFLLITTIYRSIFIEFAAVTNTYESLIIFSTVICIIIFFIRVKTRYPAYREVILGGTFLAFLLFTAASSPLIPDTMLPPIPTLRSYWLVLHVTFAFIGESFFAVSFISATASLLTHDIVKRKDLQILTSKLISAGYPVFTLGALVFGSIWARYAWGSYWSWDPKETWALITWLVYTAYLHTRFIKKLKNTFSAVLAVVGFIFTLFTFFGVNYLLSGLHSYT